MIKDAAKVDGYLAEGLKIDRTAELRLFLAIEALWEKIGVKNPLRFRQGK